MSSPAGLLASLRGLATTSVGFLRTRLELLRVELHEETSRLLGLLLWGFAAVLLGIVGLVFVAVFITVMFWEGSRLLALGLFSLFFVSSAGLAVAMAVNLARRGSGLFAASLAELRRDEAALNPDSSQETGR